jgi:phosphatidylglycerophosphatase A
VAATALATGFGSGYSPVAPGTAGSMVGLLTFWPLHWLPGAWQLAATSALLVAGVLASSRVSLRVGAHDPRVVVVDEILGMWVTLLFIPFTPAAALLGLLAFRVLDVVKPYPARQLEALPRGLGIMADDLMAGVYANLLLRIALRVLPPE